MDSLLCILLILALIIPLPLPIDERPALEYPWDGDGTYW